MNTIRLPFACAAAALALSGGCILVADPGDEALDDSAGYDSEVDDSGRGSSGIEPEPNTEPDSGEPDGSTGSSDEEPPVDDGLVCGANLLSDGGFEAGTPSEAWSEASELFGTPLCDESCTQDAGAAPFEGQWFVWFGGIDEPESASVEQSFTVDADAAFLRFRFEINAAAGSGDDVFSVRVDDTEVFMATDAEIDDYAVYQEVSIDISDFADGQPHTLTLSAAFPGTGMSNFFVDAVSVEGCEAPDDGTGGSTGGDTDTDGETDAGGDTEPGTDTETGVETDGGVETGGETEGA